MEIVYINCKSYISCLYDYSSAIKYQISITKTEYTVLTGYVVNRVMVFKRSRKSRI